MNQSEDGRGWGSWICISLSQHTGFPSPAFVHRISVSHFSQRYLLPSCAMASFLRISYFLNSVLCPQQWSSPFPPLVIINSAPHFLQIYLFPTWLAIIYIPSQVLLYVIFDQDIKYLTICVKPQAIKTLHGTACLKPMCDVLYPWLYLFSLCQQFSFLRLVFQYYFPKIISVNS